MASQVGVEAEEVKAESAGEALELEDLTPDKVLCQGEEEYGLGLDQLFLEPESEAMESDQEVEPEERTVVLERDSIKASDSCFNLEESKVVESVEEEKEVEQGVYVLESGSEL